ncbi:MAG: family 78 glycoside hydrolase catalytic domain [Clostridia bacterium]|nr:family 78 glycoside hydrolase catalytic domain [Clostridia bacterium]
MKAIRLQTEYLTEPLGLGLAAPRFSWNCEAVKIQSAYRIEVKQGNELLWDSGKVTSSRMLHIPYGGQALRSRDRVTWSVTLWDEEDKSGETVSSFFEMGLLSPSDWSARWISGNYRPTKKQRYPADSFRKLFSVEKRIASARLYAAARGVYDVHINGTRLEDFILAPGMTDYRKRIQYQTYDVTSLLQKENALELRLADGWFRGSVAAYGVTQVFGTQTSIAAQLEITFADGTVQTVVTDSTWGWSNDGPIRFADLKDGEVYDAALHPTYSGKALEVAPPKLPLTASDNVPVKEHERMQPILRPEGVLDFGQNIAGYLEFRVRGKKGQTLHLVLGEVLDASGNVDLSGIQESRPAKGWNQMNLVRKLLTSQVRGEVNPTPRQEIVFTCSGGEDHYKTSFAVFGFRYVQVRGDVQIRPEDFTAIAVYSDMEETGDFTCSNPLVNRLVENTRWSMKGNFLDVPTDCPTRERLGWTGDAQIFFDTGAYLMNTAPFFRKWLRDMEDGIYPNGLLPAVIPYSGVEMMYKATGSSVGWADAVYLVPWRYYLRYQDTQVLENSWGMIERYADYLLHHLGLQDKKAAKQNPDNAFTYEKGVHLGEWLEPEEFRDTVYGTKAKHPEECTAYLYYAMATICEIAKVLHKPADAYARCAEGARKAYLRFATLDTDRQAKLVRPLALGLLEGDTKRRAQARLCQAVENYRFRVGTGFLSTPFLLPVLTQAGAPESAYRMLENTEKPGWLAEVLDGATTVWENWEGNLSQNHYSPGAVCGWLFDTCAGIRMEGENHFVIAPVPGGTLTYAQASYLSPYGRVTSRWERTEKGIRYTVTVPANCSARLCLPGGEIQELAWGEHTYESVD